MSKNMMNPFITIDGKKCRIRIGVDVIRILGMPTSVCLYHTENCRSIAIGPCDEKKVMSFRVPEKMLLGEKCDYAICSKQFVSMIVDENQLEMGRIYRLNGQYKEGKNIVTFAVDQENKGNDPQ